MIQIHYSNVFKALAERVRDYNSRVEENKKVRSSMILTAQEIIKVYCRSVNKKKQLQLFRYKELPPLKTNNPQLAHRTQSSSRTIQRHIKRLQQAGIITKKIFHGSNADYELFLCPKLLLINCQNSAEKTKMTKNFKTKLSLKSSNNQSLKKSNESKRPDTELSYLLNNKIKGVQNEKENTTPTMDNKRCFAKERNECLELEEKEFTGYIGGKDFPKQVNKIHETKDFKNYSKKRTHKHQHLNPGTGHDDDIGGKVGTRPAGDCELPKGYEQSELARATSLKHHVELLWMQAKKVLYKDVYLTENQEYMGKRLLFKWYEPVQTENITKIHEQYSKRIELVRKFIERDPENRFVQLPNRFFNPFNPSGFAGTKVWLRLYKKQQREVQKKLITHAQIRRFLNNEKKEASKRVPSLRLFNDCKEKVAALGNQELMEKFHAAVLTAFNY